MLPVIFGFLWLIGSGHQRAEVPTAAAPSATTLVPPEPPALPHDEQPSEQPAMLPSPAPPALGAPATVFPSVGEGPAPTPLRPSAQPQAYPQTVADKPVPRVGAEPWVISEEWRAHHERQLRAPNRARAKVIFLGDSITEGWGVAPSYRDHFGKYSPLNLGLVSDVTQNVLWRVDHGALDGTHPDVLVLMIGVNNLAGGFSARDTVAGIRAILVAVQAHLPNTRVLLLGILPARQSPDDPLRQRIVEANRLLASLPPSPRVTVHDVGAVLLEPDGTITKATLRDFVHPTAAAYALLSEAVAPLIDALMGAPPSERAASESPSQTQ
jgi:beta-glucosidase